MRQKQILVTALFIGCFRPNIAPASLLVSQWSLDVLADDNLTGDHTGDWSWDVQNPLIWSHAVALPEADTNAGAAYNFDWHETTPASGRFEWILHQRAEDNESRGTSATVGTYISFEISEPARLRITAQDDFYLPPFNFFTDFELTLYDTGPQGHAIWHFEDGASSGLGPPVADRFTVDEPWLLEPGSYRLNYGVRLFAWGRGTHRVATADTTMSLIFEPLHLLGDADCSETMDANDIPAFMLALTDPAAYAAAFPACQAFNPADLDDSGVVDAADVPLFVSALLAQP